MTNYKIKTACVNEKQAILRNEDQNNAWFHVYHVDLEWK